MTLSLRHSTVRSLQVVPSLTNCVFNHDENRFAAVNLLIRAHPHIMLCTHTDALTGKRTKPKDDCDQAPRVDVRPHPHYGVRVAPGRQHPRDARFR